MKIYMYDAVPNFGDVLNKHIWPQYLGPLLEREDNIVMMGIGTVLGQEFPHVGRYVVCGSGCGYGSNINCIDDDNWIIFFVRGPLTAKTLGLSETIAITDPAILTPDIFKAALPSGRTAFVPHWETAYNPLWRKACAMADIDYIDPLAPVSEVSAGISAARLVITEAMHGAILADSYRVPWVPVATSLRINRFKWMDWLLSMNIEPEFQTLKALGFSDHFRSFALHPVKDDMERNNAWLKTPSQIRKNIKEVISKNISLDLRDQIKSRLFLKIGPHLDHLWGEKFGKNYVKRRISQSANELVTISKLPGWISDEQTHQLKKQMIINKITEVKDKLLSQ